MNRVVAGRFALILIITAAVVMIVTVASTTYVWRECADVLREVGGLGSDTTASSAQAVIHRHSRHLVTKTCESESCQYELLFTNGLISKLHLAPGADLRVYLTIVQDAIATVAVQYTSRISSANSPIVWVQEDFCRDRTDFTCSYVAINPHGMDVPTDWNGIVEFGELAEEKQKRAALRLNLRCMTAFHGCSNIAELLPTVWEQGKPGTVNSRFTNSYPECRICAQP